MSTLPGEDADENESVGSVRLDENERVAYQEISKTLSVIDDFRAKLLGLLPLSSGAGIFLLLEANPNKQYLGPIGIVGFLVSLGLFIYELSQSAICRQLIDAGETLEYKLGLTKGQFIGRRTRLPKSLKGLAKLRIGTWINVASWVVYLTVLAAWAYLAYVGLTADASDTVPG